MVFVLQAAILMHGEEPSRSGICIPMMLIKVVSQSVGWIDGYDGLLLTCGHFLALVYCHNNDVCFCLLYKDFYFVFVMEWSGCLLTYCVCFSFGSMDVMLIC